MKATDFVDNEMIPSCVRNMCGELKCTNPDCGVEHCMIRGFKYARNNKFIE